MHSHWRYRPPAGQQTLTAGQKQQLFCLNHPPDPQRHVHCRASIREPKDPAKFKNMDEARDYLMQSNGGPIAGALNFLSNAAFGAGKAGAHIGSWYRQWLSQGDDSNQSSRGGTAAAVLPSVPPESIASLALVMLVSEHRVQKLAAVYPQVLTMPPADVAARLVLLKELLPGSDVARMVELAPGLLLGASVEDLHAAKQRVDVLTEHLPGADIAFMVQEHPNLMFEELEPSLPRMYDLWPELDASTLAASDPKHLALALRALSDQGPPRRF